VVVRLDDARNVSHKIGRGWRLRILLNWRWLNATRTARRADGDYAETGGSCRNVITIDNDRIRDRVVRGTVEETLNALLDAEADRL
jgi:hypothetical protein